MTAENTCNILPCSIDADMTAHSARYFHPTILKNESGGDNATKDEVTVIAAQFRGRGLLCIADDANQKADGASKEIVSNLPMGVKGVALAPSASHSKNSSDGDNSRPLKVVGTFSQIHNWQHEHDVEKVKRSRDEGGSDKVGLKAVLGWCEVAHAVSSSYYLC